MHPIKRVLVGLDLSDIDKVVISYTSYISDLLDVDKVYFFHVSPNLELPEEIINKYPNLIAPVDETIEGIIQEKINTHFKSKVEVSIEVLEGNAEDKIIRWSDIKEIDLIVLGKKNKLKGSGLLSNRLAKVAHCSILTVPEEAPPKINKILVPVDFSSSSKMAINEAKLIADKSGATLSLLNVYVVPSGYHTIGKSYEEFAEIIKEHAQKNAEKFLDSLNIDLDSCEIRLALDEDSEPSDKIFSEAQNINSDLVIISSKGRTGLASILLGSVADKVLSYKSHIPVLVLKNKKENLGFIDALLRI